MAKVAFKGIEVHTNGVLPAVGSIAPDFIAVKNDLSELALDSLKGKRVILNIFPSLDTAVCASSVRRFNKEAASLHNTVVLAISKDLPFAQSRFCTTEGIDKVIPLSAFRNSTIEDNYGLLLVDGPLKGLFARSVLIIDEAGKIIYSELVPEITEEPNYEAALASLT
ncbi:MULTISPECIES: thiol peroxidase [unclassified Parabacteroides]|uniref:thiol peroxidase n=1 Tax=unclassified Parabacteroides TaxID=2649774 RepID=UPI002473E3D5|nr:MULTISPECIES: thiol peroxidase [unclassified Parabacteroides]